VDSPKRACGTDSRSAAQALVVLTPASTNRNGNFAVAAMRLNAPPTTMVASRFLGRIGSMDREIGRISATLKHEAERAEGSKALGRRPQRRTGDSGGAARAPRRPRTGLGVLRVRLV
jgi:uncharacterized small protein (DUF1192 family)